MSQPLTIPAHKDIYRTTASLLGRHVLVESEVLFTFNVNECFNDIEFGHSGDMDRAFYVSGALENLLINPPSNSSAAIFILNFEDPSMSRFVRLFLENRHIHSSTDSVYFCMDDIEKCMQDDDKGLRE